MAKILRIVISVVVGAVVGLVAGGILGAYVGHAQLIMVVSFLIFSLVMYQKLWKLGR